jgi:GNAT superfamily N-acetyltransferase
MASQNMLSLENIVKKCFPEGNQYVSLPDENPRFLVIKDIEKGVVGYVVYSDEEKAITDMAVLPEYRRDKNGTSKKLLDAMITHVSEEGGEWEVDLRDRSTLVYMLIQAKRGVAKITAFNNSPSYTMSNGDNVYTTKFEYVPFENRQMVGKENEPFIMQMEKIIAVKAENEQIEKENEKKIADLLIAISNILEEKGFSPETNTDSIVFEYKGSDFFIFFNKKRPNFFGVAYYIYSFEEQNEYDILKIANLFNWSLDYSRIAISGKHCFARMGGGINLDNDSPSYIANHILYICSLVLSTKYAFIERIEFE